MTAASGARATLEGARTIVAWAHGFVSMELAGAFRLGGDLDAAYAFGIESILAGVSVRRRPEHHAEDEEHQEERHDERKRPDVSRLGLLHDLASPGSGEPDACAGSCRIDA